MCIIVYTYISFLQYSPSFNQSVDHFMFLSNMIRAWSSRMVKDLDSTTKKLESEYGSLATLAGALSREDYGFDKEGIARFFGFSIRIFMSLDTVGIL